jgi:flagellar biogenesis protein FliO
VRQPSELLHRTPSTAEANKTGAIKEGLKNRYIIGLFALLAVTVGFALPEFWTVGLPLPEVGSVQGTDRKGGLTYTPPERPEKPESAALLLRLGLGTVFVLGLCVGTLWIGRHWLQGKAPTSANGSQLRIVEALSLGSHCLVYLVEVGRHQVVVGVDRAGLKALIPLTEPFESALEQTESVEEKPASPANEAPRPQKRILPIEGGADLRPARNGRTDPKVVLQQLTSLFCENS